MFSVNKKKKFNKKLSFLRDNKNVSCTAAAAAATGSDHAQGGGEAARAGGGGGKLEAWTANG
jgi:hypothetical protein